MINEDKMKVKLIDYQENALDLLLYTKNTRLAGAQSLEDIAKWPMEKKLEHLDYMKKTIASSWEFVNYTFELSGVSRVFTHQLVRTRQASYAQESQRTVNVADVPVISPNMPIARSSVATAQRFYQNMIDDDVHVQDARYILPMGTTTSIIAGVNLRTMSNMAELRLCKRTAGEYQKVFKEMVKKVVQVHPWAEQFLEVYCVKTGICAFPNYKECPVQEHTVHTSAQIPDIRHAWENSDHIANPIAKDGKSQ